MRERKFTSFIPYVEGRLENFPALSAIRIYEEIKELGYEGSIRTTRREVAKLRQPKENRAYKPFETLPGQQMQVDWATFEIQWEDGHIETIYAFVAILGYSRHIYVEYTTSMDIRTFLSCHERAFQYFEGVPLEVIYDNAKTVTEERVGSVVRFQQDLLYFSQHYGYRPHACWVMDPESKGKVESSVNYVRGNFFYGRVFRNLDQLNKEVLLWCDRVSHRIHGTTKEVPKERWMQEKEVLRSLPSHPFLVVKVEERKVDKSGLISVDGQLYSVPWPYQKKTVLIRDEGPQFAVYTLEGEWVAEHHKVKVKTAPVVKDSHYDDRPRGPLYRKQRSLQSEFERLGEQSKVFLEGLSTDRSGGQLREQMTNILKLTETYPQQEVYDALVRCCEFKNFSYAAVKTIVEKRKKNPQALPEPGGHYSMTFSTVYEDLEKVETRSASYYEEVLSS